jgi:hypothetical protein
MTRQHSFKRLVRARMAKTGESYTAARRQLLSGAALPEASKAPLATSDEKIRERTGRGWEEWFELLDDAGGQEMSHRDLARWAAAEQDIVPLAWNAQAVAGSYERARGMREVGELADGFAVTASRTVAVPAEKLYEAVTDPELRSVWLEDDHLRERKSTPAKSAHYDWLADGSRVHIHIDPKDDGRSVISLQHARLADAGARDRAKADWRERLAALKAALEGGELDG